MSADQCPCGHRGAVTSEAPPFWTFNGQMWHWDCLVKAHPEMRERMEAAKEEALSKMKVYRLWIAPLTVTPPTE